MWDNLDFEKHLEPEMEFDIVDEASAESFPASDPPTWATGQLHPGEPGDTAGQRELSPGRIVDNESRHHAPTPRDDQSPVD